MTGGADSIRGKRGDKALEEESIKNRQTLRKDNEQRVFILWNVHCMGASKENLIILIETYKPAVIACPETWYGSHFISNIAGYKGACK